MQLHSALPAAFDFFFFKEANLLYTIFVTNLETSVTSFITRRRPYPRAVLARWWRLQRQALYVLVTTWSRGLYGIYCWGADSRSNISHTTQVKKCSCWSLLLGLLCNGCDSYGPWSGVCPKISSWESLHPILYAVCGMRHAACVMRYAAKNRTYGNRVGVIPYSRFSVRYRTRYALRKNESRHVAIHAACECEFGWGNPETDVTGRGFPWISTALETVNRSVPSSVVPTLHSTHPYTLCTSVRESWPMQQQQQQQQQLITVPVSMLTDVIIEHIYVYINNTHTRFVALYKYTAPSMHSDIWKEIIKNIAYIRTRQCQAAKFQ